MQRKPMSRYLSVLLIIGLSIGSALAGACTSDSAPSGAANPHVEHVTLPTYKAWRVTAVAAYEGLEEVELVKFDWPTPEDPHVAFALSSEGLEVGDPICLDHVQEIDTFWAHPVPQGGCEAMDTPASNRP